MRANTSTVTSIAYTINVDGRRLLEDQTKMARYNQCLANMKIFGQQQSDADNKKSGVYIPGKRILLRRDKRKGDELFYVEKTEAK